MKTFKEMVLNEEIENISEAKDGSFVVTVGKFNYAVKLDGISSFSGSMSDEIMLNKKMRELKDSDVQWKKGYAYAKGKGTLPAVKKWIKEKKPSQYFAKWEKDSSSYKDDVVEIKYLD